MTHRGLKKRWPLNSEYQADQHNQSSALQRLFNARRNLSDGLNTSF